MNRRNEEYREEGLHVRPHPGDVYIIKNDCDVQKGSNLRTNIIKFSRPVIVISSVGTIATVIPCTTNSRWRDTSYPLRLSPTKISYALLAQVKTVDITMLDHEMGKLRPKVFTDFRKAYVGYVQNGEKPKISKSLLNDHKLDIKIFQPWHIYTDKDFTEYYLTFKANRKMYAIKAYPSSVLNRENMDYIDGSFMKYDPENLIFLGRRMYSKKLIEPIGIELDDWVINNVANRVKSLYELDVEPQKVYDANLKSFSEFLVRSNSNYCEKYQFIRNIPDDIIFSNDFVNINSEFYIEKIESWSDPDKNESILLFINSMGKAHDKVPLYYIRTLRLYQIDDIRVLPPNTIQWLLDNMLPEFTKIILDKYVDLVNPITHKFKTEERLKNYDNATLEKIEYFINVLMTKI